MEKYTITMLGEKDHGKSTLIGNMLISTGHTTEARINEVKKTSKSKRFEPAHILDSFSEEREQEMTIDTTRAELIYKNAIFELIDVPGHLELIKNMMSGASNSDIAILMVSAKNGEGFQPQTKRHIFLSNMFGIKALIVAVNKIDIAGYRKEAFEKIKDDVSAYLKSIKFDKPVAYVPISAYNNENLTSPSRNIKWYKGRPLFDMVDEFAKKHSKESSKGKGTRMVIQDNMEMDGKRAYFGVLYHGSIKVGESIRIEPDGISAKVEKLYVKGKKVSKAEHGNNVAVVFSKEIKVENGRIIYNSNERPHKIGSFSAKMFIIRDMDPKSKKLNVKINNNDISLKGMEIERIVSPITGKIGGKAIGIKANNVVYAGLKLGVPYPVEKYTDYSELGRFAIYDGEEFAGVGIVE
jgi:small GTP-binding protein